MSIREISKSFGTVGLYFALIVAAIYVTSLSARVIGMRRAWTPFIFAGDIRDYYNALGGFNLIDAFRIFAFFLIANCALNISANGLAPKIFKMPPYANDMDTAITKLGKLEKNDVVVKQVSPRKLVIWHSARATFPWTWYQQNEMALELPTGIDVIKWELYLSKKTVVAYFTIGNPIKRAEIWIERGSNLSRVDTGHDGPHVYAAGDRSTLEECNVLKVGFAQSLDQVDSRIDEANRWDFGNINPQVVALIPVRSRKDETAIHNLPIFDAARIKDTNRPGRELFRATPQIKNFLREMMLRNNGTGNANGNGKIHGEEMVKNT